MVRDAIVKVLLHPARRRGAGPGGSRLEHWYTLCSRPEAVSAASHCLLLLATGDAPPEVMDSFASAQLTFLAKKGGGVRPLACGTAPRRIVCKAVAQVFRERAREVCGPTQFAVARPRGAEELHKQVFTGLAIRPTNALASADVKHAHGSVHRSEAIKELDSELPALTPWVRPWLAARPRHSYTE